MYYSDINDIVKGFIEDGNPYFVFKDAKDICGFNKGNKNIEQAADKLEELLQQASKDPFGSKYTVIVCDKPINDLGKVVGKAYKYVSPKRSSEGRSDYTNKAEYYGQFFNPAIDRLQEQIKQLQEVILRKELENDSEDENLAMQSNNNVLGSFLNNENFQNALIGMFSKMFDGNSTTPAAQIPSALSGTNNEDEKIKEALNRLQKVDADLANDLLLLAAMAEKDASSFNMLLNVLRSNGK